MSVITVGRDSGLGYNSRGGIVGYVWEDLLKNTQSNYDADDRQQAQNLLHIPKY